MLFSIPSDTKCVKVPAPLCEQHKFIDSSMSLHFTDSRVRTYKSEAMGVMFQVPCAGCPAIYVEQTTQPTAMRTPACSGVDD